MTTPLRSTTRADSLSSTKPRTSPAPSSKRRRSEPIRASPNLESCSSASVVTTVPPSLLVSSPTKSSSHGRPSKVSLRLTSTVPSLSLPPLTLDSNLTRQVVPLTTCSSPLRTYSLWSTLSTSMFAVGTSTRTTFTIVPRNLTFSNLPSSTSSRTTSRTLCP